MTKKKCVVFLGPSLRQSEARKILDADYRSPAGQGDIMRACAERPPAIALIDGVFKNVPTVRHREILWALSKGIPVFGASSMGALRAAELSDHGMIGVGLIFRWYRRFPLLPDDAVAVTHAPPELGSLGLSSALVDIRRSLSAAVRAGILTENDAKAHRQRITALPFSDRLMPEEIRSIAVAQKANDARTLLHRLAAFERLQKFPEIASSQPPIVNAWIDDLNDSGIAIDLSLKG